jgi:hypothetical protein
MQLVVKMGFGYIKMRGKLCIFTAILNDLFYLGRNLKLFEIKISLGKIAF